MLSVIIPARNEIYLQKTIDGILSAAEDEVRVVVILDGYWPEHPIQDNPKVTLIHHSKPVGQRAAINEGVRISKTRYIMKVDGHCLFDEGFDVKLRGSCEYDWTTVPRRYDLDITTWTRRRRRIVDYMYLSAPNAEIGPLRAKAWQDYNGNGNEIEETMGCQGSCFFMHCQRYWELGGLDEGHGGWGQMGAEIALKTWLSGGKLVVNKSTWYAHWQRGKYPYKLQREDKDKARDYCLDLWLNNKWVMQKHKLQWLVEKFTPVPTWENYKW